ncbi:hypothetical protein ES705_08824 [subsurface metagenome]
MVKRFLLIPLMVVLAGALIFGGCAAPAPAPAPVAPAPAPEEAVITWKVQSANAAAHPSCVYTMKLCDAVTKASGGQLVFKGFSGGSIVPVTKEIVQGVHKGVIQATWSCPGYAVGTWPTAALFGSRPGQMEPSAMRLWFTEWGGVELLNKTMEGYNVLVLPAVQPDPPEIFLQSTVPIESLDDLIGLKMRAMGDCGEILSRMGASVVFMPGGEVYEAVARGTIDAFEFAPASVNWDLGFQEVTKYVYLSGSRAALETCMFFVNKDAWEKLPPNFKQLVQDEVFTWMTKASLHTYAESLKAIDKFRDYGCVVERIPPAISDGLLEEAVKFYNEQAAKQKPIYTEVLEAQRAFKNAYDKFEALN